MINKQFNKPYTPNEIKIIEEKRIQNNIQQNVDNIIFRINNRLYNGDKIIDWNEVKGDIKSFHDTILNMVIKKFESVGWDIIYIPRGWFRGAKLIFNPSGNICHDGRTIQDFNHDDAQ